MMQVLIATGNAHKRDEIRAVFEQEAGENGGMTWLTLAELDERYEEPEENGQTFEANAALKARYYAQASGHVCLADDSGLEVDALGGEPGVYSARYSGVSGSRQMVDRANNAKLLGELAGVEPERRTARFVCAMALAVPGWDEPPQWLPRSWVDVIEPSREARVIESLRGTVEGRIIEPAEAADGEHPERGRGENGFGYDPLFEVPDLGCTTAELTPEHKNAISHRGQAARAMYRRLREQGLV